MSLSRYVRPHLDVLFVALNPPKQSHSNGHWFSGNGSRFFKLLYESGLITEPVDKRSADELVFGSTTVNYRQRTYGVIDPVADVVETNSGKVRPTRESVDRSCRIVTRS